MMIHHIYDVDLAAKFLTLKDEVDALFQLMLQHQKEGVSLGDDSKRSLLERNPNNFRMYRSASYSYTGE